MEIPIIGQAGQEGFYPVNFYYSPELENGGAGLVNTPGLTLYKLFSAGTEVRGMWDMDGVLYVVAGNTVYRWTGGASTTCTGNLSDATGRVWMCDNGTQLMITNGTNGYYVTGTTVTQITDADFPTPAALAFQDGYGIIVESGTGNVWISAYNDFSSWDGLDYTIAGAEPDDALSVFSSHRELYVFGTESTETYYNSGNADFPFDRIAGGYIERGIGASQTAVKADNAIVWFSNRRQVLATLGPGHSPTVISTPQLHKEFEGYTTVSDAFAYTMDILGFTWYVLCFPTESKTYVYNFATKRWHQWAGFAGGVETRHYSNCYVYHDNKHLVGHYNNGTVYQVDTSAYSDYGNTFRSIARFPTIIKEGSRIFHNKLQIDFKAGVGLSTGLATGTANMVAGALSTITIADGGSGYTAAPLVEITGGGGSGAYATATLTADVVTGTTVVAGGSGYTSTPTITFVGGTQDPQAMLRWSDDRRRTWSNEHWTSIGRIGEYAGRAVWRRLGQSWTRNYEVTISDAVERVIYGAYLNPDLEKE